VRKPQPPIKCFTPKTPKVGKNPQLIPEKALHQGTQELVSLMSRNYSAENKEWGKWPFQRENFFFKEIGEGRKLKPSLGPPHIKEPLPRRRVTNPFPKSP